MSRDVGTRHVLTDATGKSRARPATHVARRVPGSCVLLGGTQPLLRISQPCCAPDVQQMWPPKRHAAAAACCSNVLLCTASTLCVRRTVSAQASLISTDEALPVRAAARGKRRWRMFRARLHRVAFMQNRVTLYTACYACILHMCRQGLYAQMTCVCVCVCPRRACALHVPKIRRTGWVVLWAGSRVGGVWREEPAAWAARRTGGL